MGVEDETETAESNGMRGYLNGAPLVWAQARIAHGETTHGNTTQKQGGEEQTLGAQSGLDGISDVVDTNQEELAGFVAEANVLACARKSLLLGEGLRDAREGQRGDRAQGEARGSGCALQGSSHHLVFDCEKKILK